MGLRLGIDMDGVIADFNGGWMRDYNARYAAELTPDLVEVWDGLHELTHFESMTKFWKWAATHDGRTIFRHLDPYPGAIEALTHLRDAGHQIVIITAKPQWSHSDTFHWIGHHNVPTAEVHMTEAKYSVDVDVYLDDSPYQVPELVEKRPDRTVCRFIRPWNGPVEGAVDVADFAEFIAVVETLAAERGA